MYTISMNNLSNSLTFRLFKKRKTSLFIDGMASILDISDSERLYNYEKTSDEADRNAVHDDWLQVGRDLREAMTEYASRKTAR